MTRDLLLPATKYTMSRHVREYLHEHTIPTESYEGGGMSTRELGRR